MDASLQFKSLKEVIVDTSSNSGHRWQVRAVGGICGWYICFRECSLFQNCILQTDEV